MPVLDARPDYARARYYVVDGRHRVSVSRALGRRHIDAKVTRTSDVPAVAA